MDRKKTTYSERYESLCLLLIKARENKKFTQTELSVRLNRPQSFVSKYENGERRVDVEEFLQICDALSIDAAKLIQKLQEMYEY